LFVDLGRRAAICCAVLATYVGPAGAADPPFRYEASELDAVARDFSGLGHVYLDEDIFFELEYDRSKDVLRGKSIRTYGILIRTRSALESFQYFSVLEDPSLELKKARFFVQKPDGSVKQVRDRDLQWFERIPQFSGIYIVDGVEKLTMIPDLEVGDILIWQTETKLEQWHGAPIVDLGGSNTLRSHLRVKLKGDDVRLDHRLRRGPGEAKFENVEYLGSGASESGDDEWDYTPSHEEIHGGAEVRVVLHLADPEGRMAAAEDWATAGDAFLEFVDDRFEANDALRAEALRTVADVLGDPRASIDALYRYVQGSCRYLGLYTGRGGILPDPAVEVFEEGHSDCKGLGGLLISMLRAVEIDASPVLLHTDDGFGISPELANMAQFDHFIVWANDGSEDGVWLDATTDSRPAGALPWADRVENVLLIKPGASRMVTIPSSMWNRGSRDVQLLGEITPRLEIQGQVEERSEGEPAVRQRLIDEKIEARDREEYRLQSLSASEHLFRMVIDRAESSGENGYLVACSLASVSALASASQLVFLPSRLFPFELPSARALIDEGADLIERQEDRVEGWRLKLPPGLHLPEAVDRRFETAFVNWTCAIYEADGQLHLRRAITWYPEAELGDASVWKKAYQRLRKQEAGQIQLRLSETR
jgi:hypothetical protein